MQNIQVGEGIRKFGNLNLIPLLESTWETYMTPLLTHNSELGTVSSCGRQELPQRSVGRE